MTTKRSPSLALLAALTMLATIAPWTGSARAEEIMRESFEQKETLSLEAQEGITVGRNGDGWTQTNQSFELLVPVYVEHNVNFGRIDRGMISFDLQRKPGQTTSSPREPRSVFALKNKIGENLLLTQITWESAFDPERAMLTLTGAPYYTNGMGLWSPWILIDKKINEGQWIHIDLLWDDAQSLYKLHIDGEEQNAEPKYHSLLLKKELPDPRIAANDNNAKQGIRPRYFAKPFGDLLSQARSALLGANWAKGHKKATSPMSNAVLDNFVIVADEKLEELHTQAHDVKNLKGVYIEEASPERAEESGANGGSHGILLTWAPPEIHGIDQSYIVYRRPGSKGGVNQTPGEANQRFEKLTEEPTGALSFLDGSVKKGQTYRYAVAAKYTDLKGRNLESKYPPEITATASPVAIDAVAAEKTIYGLGQEIAVTIKGTKDLNAVFRIEGATENIETKELDDGTYVGKIIAPPGLNKEKAKLIATLIDAQGKELAELEGAAITIDQTPPERIEKIIATIPWGGEIELSWEKSPSSDVDHYLVYRGEGTEPDPTKEPYEKTKKQTITDLGTIGGLEYRYLAVPVDLAGNIGPAGDVVAIKAEPGEGPQISGINITPFGKALKPGEIATITVIGQSGGQCLVDIGEIAKGIELKEKGRTGEYAGTLNIERQHIQLEKTQHRIIASLADSYGSVQTAGPELLITGQNQLNDQTPPEIKEITHNAFQAAGMSGVLVPGDVLEATLKGEKGCFASFQIEGAAQSVAMEEKEEGLYKGSWTIGWDLEGKDLKITAKLSDEAGNETQKQAAKPATIDARVRLKVTANKKLLPADQKSKARIIVEAQNANGDKIKGHEIALALATTEDYTGVVGGGALEGRKATKDDEDDLEIKWGGITDNFGQISADYTVGNAAKTAVIIAKDLTTGRDVGYGWLNAYISATTAIELLPRTKRNAQDLANLEITAEPAKLTADGRSKSRIKAKLTDIDTGKPLEGKRIYFGLGSENGKLKILGGGRTDANGVAQAEYRAGTAMGSVTITAAANEYQVTATIDITLMSDAPAKIALKAEAKELPADGSAETDLLAMVSDINDNPNNLAPVEIKIIQGGGKIEESDLLTDKNGESRTKYKAGTKPGTTIIEAKHTSRAPTRAEERRMHGTIYVPRLVKKQERERMKIAEWLIEPGEEAIKGQALAVLESRNGTWTLKAAWDGVFVRRTKHERDEVELGDVVGYMELDGESWEEALRQ